MTSIASKCGFVDRDRAVRIDDMDVHVLDRGRGQPVLLLHGNPDCAESWLPVMDELATTHRCVAPDFPGFGLSTEPPPTFDFLPDGQARFWNRFFDAAGVEQPCIVVVHDFGGPGLPSRPRGRSRPLPGLALTAYYTRA